MAINKNDSLRTDYVLYPNYKIKTITDPNNIELKYHYDDYGRLSKAFENNRLLEENSYHYWDRNNNLGYMGRAGKNYVEAYSYNEASLPNIYNGVHSKAYMDVYGRTLQAITAVKNDSVELHSGLAVLDNWDRINEQLKPHVQYGIATNNLSLGIDLFADSELHLYENDGKNRLLRRAAHGINNVFNPHTIKTVLWLYQ